MTVSTLPAIAAPEVSAEAAASPGVAMLLTRDAAAAAGAVAGFPLLLQLLQQTAEQPQPSPEAALAPLAWEAGLVRGLLPAAPGAVLPGPEAGGVPESEDETDADHSEAALIAGLAVPPALAALPAPALVERPAPAAAGLAEAVVAPVVSSEPAAAALPAEPLRPSAPAQDTPLAGLPAQPEETPATADAVTVTLPEGQGRPRAETPGSDSTPLRAEARAAVGHVAASRRDESRSDAGGGDASRDDDPRTAEPSARVDRGGPSAAGLDARARGTAETSDPPASAERSAARPLVEQVVTRLTPLRQGRQEVSLRLEPADLGSIRVEAVLDGPRLSLRITAEHESAKSLLEGTLPRLRESLSQQGFVADQLTVQLGLDASARDFTGRAFTRFERPGALDLPTRTPDAVSPTPRWRPASTDGLDLWA